MKKCLLLSIIMLFGCPRDECVRSVKQIIHHDSQLDVTTYIATDTPMLTPAYDEVKDVCVEWKVVE